MGLDISVNTLTTAKTENDVIIDNSDIDYVKALGLSKFLKEDDMGFYDIEGKLKSLVENSKKEDWEFIELKPNLDYDLEWTCEHIPTKTRYSFTDRELCINIKRVNIMYCEDADKGYLRNGMKDEFYTDMENDTIRSYVLEKSVLEEYLDKYVKDESKESFKEEIIDTFVDGKTIATFSW